MLSFGWSPLVRQPPSPLVPLVILSYCSIIIIIIIIIILIIRKFFKPALADGFLLDSSK